MLMLGNVLRCRDLDSFADRSQVEVIQEHTCFVLFELNSEVFTVITFNFHSVVKPVGQSRKSGNIWKNSWENPGKVSGESQEYPGKPHEKAQSL